MEALAIDPNTDSDKSDLHVLFSAYGQTYGIPYQYVMEMVQPPTSTPLPNTNPAVHGVINLRGTVLGLVDFRIALGLPEARSDLDQLISELNDLESGHKQWLGELRASASDGHDFKLTTDAHTCPVGRWFDRLQTTNVIVGQLARRSNAPHQRIHAVAHEVAALVRSGKKDEALALIERTRVGELARMCRYFDEAREALSESIRTIAIIVQPDQGSKVAVIVDSVDGIESLDVAGGDNEQTNTCIPPENSQIICGVAKSEEDAIVLLVDPLSMYRIFSGDP